MTEGLRTTTYYLNSRTYLTDAIQGNRLNDLFLADRGIPSAQSFLYEHTEGVSSYDNRLRNLILPSPVTWRFYQPLLEDNFLMHYSKIDFLGFLSLSRSYIYENMGMTPALVMQNFPLLRQANIDLMAVTNTAVSNLVNKPVKNAILSYL